MLTYTLSSYCMYIYLLYIYHYICMLSHTLTLHIVITLDINRMSLTHTHVNIHTVIILYVYILIVYISLHMYVITYIDTTHCYHPGHQPITLDVSAIILGRRLLHLHRINLSPWLYQLSPWVYRRLHHLHPGSFRLLWRVILGYDFYQFKRFSYSVLDNSALDCATEPNLHRLDVS